MRATYEKQRGFTLTRRYSARPEQVWMAWTAPGALGWFFNPDNPVETPISLDLRVGGEWRQMMIISPEHSYMTGGLYTEIVPNRRLQFYHGARGGWPELDPERPENCPLCTMTLEAVPGGTEMTFLVQLPDHFSETETQEWMDCGMVPGWNMTIDRMLPELRLAA